MPYIENRTDIVFQFISLVITVMTSKIITIIIIKEANINAASFTTVLQYS
jgi:hypothetical protein